MTDKTMLQPKELMLGNWVYLNGDAKYPVRVEAVYTDYVFLQPNAEGFEIFSAREDEICPIPLTEEVFGKNGFEYLTGVFYLKQDSNVEFYKDDDGMFYMSANLCEYKCMEQPIKYVHQLQNILTIAGIDIDFKI